MVDLRQALAAAARPDALVAERNAFVIGNVGKLGEELLNAVLESPDYARVTVAVGRAMRTVATRLSPIVLPPGRAGWDHLATLKRAPEDLFICLEAPRVSYWKVHTPYVAMTSEQMVALARHMRSAGARRLAVVTPLEAHQHLGAESFIRSVDEISLIEAGFERIVILRPSVEEAASAAQGLGESVADLVLRTVRSVMMPKRLEPVRKLSVARAAVRALSTLDDGVHVLGAARLRELAGGPSI